MSDKWNHIVYNLSKIWDIIHIPQNVLPLSIFSAQVSTFARLYHNCLTPEYFHQSKKQKQKQNQPTNQPKKPLMPISIHCPFLSSSQVLETSHLLFITMDLHIPDISYKLNHKICGLLCLASFTEHVFTVHLCCSMFQYFYSFNNIHLYGYTTFCLFTHRLMNIWADSTFGYYK